MCCQMEIHFRFKDNSRLKVNGQKKIGYANSNQNKAGVAILISHRIDFKTRNVTREKEGHN